MMVRIKETGKSHAWSFMIGNREMIREFINSWCNFEGFKKEAKINHYACSQEVFDFWNDVIKNYKVMFNNMKKNNISYSFSKLKNLSSKISRGEFS